MIVSRRIELSCDGIGFFDAFDKHEVLLQFTHRGRPFQIRVSAQGWAQIYLKENPWTSSQPGGPQPHHIAHVAHRKPPHRRPIHSFQKPKEEDLSEPEEAASPRGDFIPEWWAISSGMQQGPPACRRDAAHRCPG
jgi:hypothetical protein